MTRGRMLLLAQADHSPPLGPPPRCLDARERAIWGEIVAACPDVLRATDVGVVTVAALQIALQQDLLAHGLLDRSALRQLYRLLGTLFVPVAARRRLIFSGSAPPSRSRRV